MNTENKVRYGLTNVHIAPILKEMDGKEVYGEFKRLRGAVNLTLTPVGDKTPFYADNMAYYTFTANAGYDGTLEVAEIPEFFLLDILGEDKKEVGVILEKINSKGKSFAMAFEFDGDIKARRFILYNCTANRPNLSGSTVQESIDPQTSELSFTAASNQQGIVMAKTSKDTAEEIYNQWYTEPIIFEDDVVIEDKTEEEVEQE